MGRGFLVYMVGTSGSGKTTIGRLLTEMVRERGQKKIQFIDGDEIRAQFGDVFGYSYEERMKCNRAVRTVVQYLVNNDINVILAQVAAYRSMRQAVRGQFGECYAEVYVKCSPEECARRDPKGYYAAEIKNLNGVTDAFEPPEGSEIVVDTEKLGAEEAAEAILFYLEGNGYEL